MALDQMHDAGSEQRCPDQNDEAAEQSPTLRVERLQQGAHAGGVAREFEKSDHAKDQHHAEVGRQGEREPERQYGEEIDDPESAGHEFQSSLSPVQMTVGRVFDRNPEPQSVLDGENGEREQLDDGEQRPVARLELRHRFQGDCEEIDDDEENDQPADESTGSVADRAVLQDLIKPAAKRRGSAPTMSRQHVDPGRWLGS